ncbi:hypothetical protein JVU11DRAFT_2620 [Chiua virens]|nr:hypothetical protein JVU11DRAFT_2620 [Chiua virens]
MPSNPISVCSHSASTYLSVLTVFQGSDNLDDHKEFSILTIPRARRVHQPMWTVPPTFIRSCLACIYLVTITPLLKAGSLGTPFADLLILNGPGTCVPLCITVVANKVSASFTGYHAITLTAPDQFLGPAASKN